MRSAWLTHKGHKYFYCNYSYLTVAVLESEMREVDEYIGGQPENSVVILTDVRGLVGTPQVFNMFRQSTIHTKKYICRSAVLGIGFSGPKKVLFDLVMRISGQNVVVFDDEEAAKDWLVAG
jgi:hypothetical protein